MWSVDLEHRHGALCTPPTTSLFMPACSKVRTKCTVENALFLIHTTARCTPVSWSAGFKNAPSVGSSLGLCKAVCMAIKCVQHQNCHLRLASGKNFFFKLEASVSWTRRQSLWILQVTLTVLVCVRHTAPAGEDYETELSAELELNLCFYS